MIVFKCDNLRQEFEKININLQKQIVGNDLTIQAKQFSYSITIPLSHDLHVFLEYAKNRKTDLYVDDVRIIQGGSILINSMSDSEVSINIYTNSSDKHVFGELTLNNLPEYSADIIGDNVQDIIQQINNVPDVRIPYVLYGLPRVKEYQDLNTWIESNADLDMSVLYPLVSLKRVLEQQAAVSGRRLSGTAIPMLSSLYLNYNTQENKDLIKSDNSCSVSGIYNEGLCWNRDCYWSDYSPYRTWEGWWRPKRSYFFFSLPEGQGVDVITDQQFLEKQWQTNHPRITSVCRAWKDVCPVQDLDTWVVVDYDGLKKYSEKNGDGSGWGVYISLYYYSYNWGEGGSSKYNFYDNLNNYRSGISKQSTTWGNFNEYGCTLKENRISSKYSVKNLWNNLLTLDYANKLNSIKDTGRMLSGYFDKSGGGIYIKNSGWYKITLTADGTIDPLPKADFAEPPFITNPQGGADDQYRQRVRDNFYIKRCGSVQLKTRGSKLVQLNDTDVENRNWQNGANISLIVRRRTGTESYTPNRYNDTPYSNNNQNGIQPLPKSIFKTNPKYSDPQLICALQWGNPISIGSVVEPEGDYYYKFAPQDEGHLHEQYPDAFGFNLANPVVVIDFEFNDVYDQTRNITQSNFANDPSFANACEWIEGVPSETSLYVNKTEPAFDNYQHCNRMGFSGAVQTCVWLEEGYVDLILQRDNIEWFPEYMYQLNTNQDGVQDLNQRDTHTFRTHDYICVKDIPSLKYTLDVEIVSVEKGWDVNVAGESNTVYNLANPPGIVDNKLNFMKYLPSMKVDDFITNLCKYYNILYSVDLNTIYFDLPKIKKPLLYEVQDFVSFSTSQEKQVQADTVPVATPWEEAYGYTQHVVDTPTVFSEFYNYPFYVDGTYTPLQVMAPATLFEFNDIDIVYEENRVEWDTNVQPCLVQVDYLTTWNGVELYRTIPAPDNTQFFFNIKKETIYELHTYIPMQVYNNADNYRIRFKCDIYYIIDIQINTSTNLQLIKMIKYNL